MSVTPNLRRETAGSYRRRPTARNAEPTGPRGFPWSTRIHHTPRGVRDDSLTARARQSSGWGQRHSASRITPMWFGIAPLRARATH
jgi:hypothetical protein